MYGAYAQDQGYYHQAQAVPVQAPTRPVPAQSQYEPASPARTRQRSISGGQRSGPAREAREQVRAEHRQQEWDNYPSNEYAYDDKSSTGQLVRGQSYSTQGTGKEGYEMKQRGSHEPMPGVIGNKGGRPIRKGEVPFEEMSDFFGEVSGAATRGSNRPGTQQAAPC